MAATRNQEVNNQKHMDKTSDNNNLLVSSGVFSANWIWIEIKILIFQQHNSFSEKDFVASQLTMQYFIQKDGSASIRTAIIEFLAESIRVPVLI